MKRRDEKRLKENTVVCKFQRPLLASDEDMNRILVYDKSRSIEFTRDMSDEDIKFLFPDNEYKTYWVCLRDKKKPDTLSPIALLEGEEW